MLGTTGIIGGEPEQFEWCGLEEAPQPVKDARGLTREDDPPRGGMYYY
jgi:hypothetical protein